MFILVAQKMNGLSYRWMNLSIVTLFSKFLIFNGTRIALIGEEKNLNPFVILTFKTLRGLNVLV